MALRFKSLRIAYSSADRLKDSSAPPVMKGWA